MTDSRACSNMLPFCYPADVFSDLEAFKTWQESEKGKKELTVMKLEMASKQLMVVLPFQEVVADLVFYIPASAPYFKEIASEWSLL